MQFRGEMPVGMKRRLVRSREAVSNRRVIGVGDESAGAGSSGAALVLVKDSRLERIAPKNDENSFFWHGVSCTKMCVSLLMGSARLRGLFSVLFLAVCLPRPRCGSRLHTLSW